MLFPRGKEDLGRTAGMHRWAMDKKSAGGNSTSQYVTTMKYENQILIGDVLEQLQQLPDGGVQTCVTSPPYWGLRDYGVEGQIGLEKTPEEYTEKMVAVFRDVRRVLCDDGTLWINLGDSYANDSKWGGQTSGKHVEYLHRQNLTRGKKTTGLKAKDLIGIPWRVAFALQADGWYLRSDIIWSKPNPMPESVTDRPTKAHEYVFLMSKSAKYYCDMDSIRDPQSSGYPSSFEKRGESWHSHDADMQKGNAKHNMRDHGKDRSHVSHPLGRNRRTVWEIATQPYPEAHFATFPEKLVEPCVLAGSRERDLVLDPFMGSGTTALVALKAQRKFVGIELNPEYAELAKKRIAQELAQGRLL